MRGARTAWSPTACCRAPCAAALETARIAFGRVDEAQPVTNAGLEPEPARQVREMRAVATIRSTAARPSSWLSHGTTIAAVTGIAPQPGEMLIVKAARRRGKFELVACLRVRASP